MLSLFIGSLGAFCALSFLDIPMLWMIAILGALDLWLVGGYISVAAIMGRHFEFLHGIFVLDPLGGFFLAILSVVAGAVVLYNFGEIRQRGETKLAAHQSSFSLGLTFAFIIAMILSVSGKNLGLIWVCVEGTTLISALSIGILNDKSALEAAWKYVILCTVGLSFSLFGLILIIHGATAAGFEPSLEPDALALMVAKFSPSLLKLAFILILVGYGTKAGFAPVHSWLPDAHSQAPAPTSALLSAVLLNCSLYAIIRTAGIMQAAGLGSFAKICLVWFGLMSITLATFFLLVQSDLKRMLAYSSIEHIGLAALGFGLGTPLSIFAALLHLIGHSAAKALAFLSAGEMVHIFHSHEMIRMVGAIRRMPVTGGGLALAMVVLSGMPPFSIFFSELLLIWAALTAGNIFLASLVLICLATAFSGIVFQGTRVLLGEDIQHHHHDESHDHNGVQDPGWAADDHIEEANVGFSWRRFSMIVLMIVVFIVPIFFFSPFQEAIVRIAEFIPGGLR